MTMTTEQTLKQQKADAERSRALTAAGDYDGIGWDENALSEYQREAQGDSVIVGDLARFDGKRGAFVNKTSDEVIPDTRKFVAYVDQLVVGYQKFTDDGAERRVGQPFKGFRLPRRKDLGDDDTTKWERGLDGNPQDPWQLCNYLLLEDTESGQLLTYTTASVTGRRSVAALVQSYRRAFGQDAYPVIQLRVGGFKHRDPKIGFVPTPILNIVGRVQRNSQPAKQIEAKSAAKEGGSLDDLMG
jgi:hypothetical protein